MSTAKFDTLSNLAGTQSVPVETVAQGSAKCWVNFNGTGTVAIRASFNVSSITDNGVGDYTVNFTTAMPDANFVAVCSASGNAASSSVVVAPFTSGTSQVAPTVTTVRLTVVQALTSQIDSPFIQVAIFR